MKQKQLSTINKQGWSKANLHIKELTEEHGSHLRWAFPPSSPECIEQKVPALYTLLAKK
ncbi:hypothetical protein [Bacillus manliponensis]|uniref:hypothetical protein n=1 Tax=Bacillus manliponensis TaxID=574376 RepID=UPI000A893C61